MFLKTIWFLVIIIFMVISLYRTSYAKQNDEPASSSSQEVATPPPPPAPEGTLSDSTIYSEEELQAADTSLESCTNNFAQNKASTCFTGGNDPGAGVRWFWTDGNEGAACKDKVDGYSVEVSSSLDGHNTKYKIYVKGKEANSIGYNNFHPEFTNNKNIKFYITPLDSSGNPVARTIIPEIDRSESSESCDNEGISRKSLGYFNGNDNIKLVNLNIGCGRFGRGCRRGGKRWHLYISDHNNESIFSKASDTQYIRYSTPKNRRVGDFNGEISLPKGTKIYGEGGNSKDNYMGPYYYNDFPHLEKTRV